jgi:hypothetical protein
MRPFSWAKFSIFTKLFSKQQQQKHKKMFLINFPSFSLHHTIYIMSPIGLRINWMGCLPRWNFLFCYEPIWLAHHPKKIETMETSQKRRFYFEAVNSVESPLSTQNTTWEKKNTSHHPQEKRRDNISFHGTLLIGCHYFWPELSTVPRAIILYNLFRHGSTTWEPCLIDNLLWKLTTEYPAFRISEMFFTISFQ